MSAFFEILERNPHSAARCGVLRLAHGDVHTPVFMPVGTKGAVKAVSREDLEEIGSEIILANTYHLYLRPGVPVILSSGGLHGFTKWERNFLTDSGGFQAWSLGALRRVCDDGIEFRSILDGSAHFFTPESVVRMQVAFQSDIQMQLDVCTPYGASYEESERAMRLSANWARRAQDEWGLARNAGYKGAFFPIVQGNFFDDLRRQSAERVNALGAQGCAIGGLSVGEPREVFCEKLHYTAQLLDDTKPRYVMGIGTPDYILEAIDAGIDMFDCVSPTRLGRHGVYLHHNGMLSIKQKRFEYDMRPIDSECGCKVCRTYSRMYLRHLFREGEILSSMLASYHNLYFLNNMISEAREAIREGRFGEYKRRTLERFRTKEF